MANHTTRWPAIPLPRLTYCGLAPPILRPPTTLLTMSVAAEPKNRTPIDSHDFHRNSLSCSPQIMANERAVPAAMEMMQIVQQTLFSTVRFMAISFEKGVIDVLRVSAW